MSRRQESGALGARGSRWEWVALEGGGSGRSALGSLLGVAGQRGGGDFQIRYGRVRGLSAELGAGIEVDGAGGEGDVRLKVG